MSFIADKQTLEDLQLLGKFRPQSIYSLFNKVKTAGGERLLEKLFHHPMTDPQVINTRSRTFASFQEQRLRFPFERESFLVVEQYLNAAGSNHALTAAAGIWRKKLLRSLLRDEQYDAIQNGLTATIAALQALRQLLQPLAMEWLQPIKKILADSRLAALLEENNTIGLSVLKMAQYDLLLRHTLREEMEQLLDAISELDVNIAVSDVARVRGLSYAHALPASANTFRASALRHPALDVAIANPLLLDGDSNVLFLTGANMAGKSTFMKSFGIALYLAHMGFPVAAGDMEFSVRDGLYSSINVPDNLQLGYSHFYAEVLRVKPVAEAVSGGRNMVVIFDELFKGTNVKDAYDATLAVTAAFAQYRNCSFIISTHIIEVGAALQQAHPNIQFSYMPTIMKGTIPRYTYQLTTGITSDRHGMIIIENEKILDIINA